MQSTQKGGAGGDGEVSKYEFDALRRNMQGVEHSLTERLELLQKMLEESLNKIYMRFQNSPTDLRVDQLENRMGNIVTLDRFKALQDDMADLAPLAGLERLGDRINTLDTRFVTHIKHEVYMEELQKGFDEKLEERVTLT